MMRILALFLAASVSGAFTPAAVNRAVPASTATPVEVAPLLRRKSTDTSATALSASMLQKTDLPEKLYFPKEKEIPKVLGGLKIGLRQLIVITGASSGLGLYAAKTLVKTGRYFVVMACRDVEKAKNGMYTKQFRDHELLQSMAVHTNLCFQSCTNLAVAKEMGFPDNSYTVMKLELGSLQSVRDFVANLKAFKSARPLKHLICNAAVYRPTDPQPAWTDDGFEMSMGVNHLGHFLLVNLLLEDMSRAKGARVCIVGSITGNTNTVGGGLVYPFADLGNLQGMEKGAKKPIAMADGKPFFGAKAYKDSKVSHFMAGSEWIGWMVVGRYADSLSRLIFCRVRRSAT
jgi:protochlorophyllide reductase